MDKDLEKEILNAIDSAPTFGQSLYQNERFVLNKLGSPGRTKRQIALELNQRYYALKEAEIGKAKTEAKIRKSKEKLSSLDVNSADYDIEKCKLDLLELNLNRSDKLARDAMRECNHLYAALKQIPDISDEQFELEEKKYWESKLLLDAELSCLSNGRIDVGTAQALISIGIDPVQTQVQITSNLSKITNNLIKQTQELDKLEGKK